VPPITGLQIADGLPWPVDRGAPNSNQVQVVYDKNEIIYVWELTLWENERSPDDAATTEPNSEVG
jgi:hypothetical protein